MQKIIKKLKLIFQDKTLRKRVFFTLAGLIVFRLFSNIPIPGVNEIQLARFFSENQLFGLINVFSGGGLSNLSIVMLGVGPYITASIIMQLLTMMSPKLKAMYQEEGEAGRRKFSQYSRWISVPLATLQAYGFIILLQNQGVLDMMSPFSFAVNVIVVAAGSVLLMWIGELITEFGIGNGISLMIFGGIVSSLPSFIAQTIFSFSASQIPVYALFLVIAIVIIYGVVYITEAERPIPVTYAKQVRGNRVYGGVSTYIPLRLNQAGVIPIIFALSILLFPQFILGIIAGGATNESIKNGANMLLSLLSQDGVFYAVLYFLFVFVFTYFYTAVTFDPHQIAENLQKNGAFIPGIRPGQSTSEYIGKILTRITFVGALFLGFIAVLPLIMRGITGISSLTIGGTALLIVVSVVLDLIKKIDAQLSMREY